LTDDGKVMHTDAVTKQRTTVALEPKALAQLARIAFAEKRSVSAQIAVYVARGLKEDGAK